MVNLKNPAVFRAYDVRGIVGKDFDEQWVTRLGQACGTYFRKLGIKKAVIGMDCRESSPIYNKALTLGLISTGIDVINIGQVGTPVLYFAVVHLATQAGIMITASHNPPEYNGFKIWAGKTTIHTSEIQAIREIMEQGDFPEGEGVATQHDIIPAYIDAALKHCKLARPLKVVVDGGNGVGADLAGEILSRMGVDVICQFCDPDPTFPNHHPDPSVEANMLLLRERVLKEKADFGIGLDGDADRIAVMDEKGRILFGDELLALFARELLARKPGSIVMGEVKCSHLMYKDIEEHGGKPLMWITGHSIIKAKMHEIGAALAGEVSGHMFFSDGWFGFDDAIYGSARFASLFSQQDKALSVLPGWPNTAKTPEIHVPCSDNIKFQVVETAKAYFRSKYDIIDIDGVRVTFPDGWGLIRVSNTQPVLVLRFEAETESRLKEIQDLMQGPLQGWIKEAEGK